MQVGRTKKKALWLEMDGQRWEKPDDLPEDSRKELIDISRNWVPGWSLPRPVFQTLKPMSQNRRKIPSFPLLSSWRTPKKEPAFTGKS